MADYDMFFDRLKRDIVDKIRQVLLEDGPPELPGGRYPQEIRFTFAVQGGDSRSWVMAQVNGAVPMPSANLPKPWRMHPQNQSEPAAVAGGSNTRG